MRPPMSFHFPAAAFTKNTKRDVISDIRNGFAWPPTFAVFIRDLFLRFCRFPISVLVGGGRHFRLGQSFVEGSLPARQAHHQDVTARRTHSFVVRAGVGSFPLPVAQRDNLCSARFINQVHRLRSVSLLASCTLGRSQELRGVSAHLYVARFPDTSVFKDAQDVVRGIASVLPPKKQSVPIDPRYTLLMLRPQFGHAIRRLRLVLIRLPVVCEQVFGAPCSIDWVLVANIYNDSLRCCAPGDSYDGPRADQAFSCDG